MYNSLGTWQWKHRLTGMCLALYYSLLNAVSVIYISVYCKSETIHEIEKICIRLSIAFPT